MINHEHYMRLAIQVADGNPSAPFATILVDIDEDRAVGEGLNRASQNPIWHGEIDAIHRYAEGGDQRWSRLRLYTTAEPCCMCQSAIIWAGIPEVVFGTSIERLTQLGWKQFRLTATDVAASADFADCRIRGGILAAECDQLFEQART